MDSCAQTQCFFARSGIHRRTRAAPQKLSESIEVAASCIIGGPCESGITAYSLQIMGKKITWAVGALLLLTIVISGIGMAVRDGAKQLNVKMGNERQSAE